jgi:uncharacterized membrane protein HdeD (DUF308 family)
MDVLARNWWALALRGIVAVLFGIAALIWPGGAVTALVLLFGAYMLVDGIFAIIASFRAAEARQRWWPLLVEGLLDLAAGIVTLIFPRLTAVVLVLFIAAWAIITGVLEIIAAVRLRRELSNEWLLGLSGVVSVIFGLLLAVFPGAGLVTLAWLIGFYALLFGILLLILAFRLRGWEQGHRGPLPA